MVRQLSIVQIAMSFIILLFFNITTGCICRQTKVVVQRLDFVPDGEQSNKISHEVPRIYGDKVVWTVHINDEDAIFMYDLNKNNEYELPVSKGSRIAELNIYENTIAWSLGTWDAIMAYDISTDTQTEIVTRTKYAGHKTSPSIYGNKVVWEDYRDGGAQIYMYDMTSETETLISDIDYAPELINNGVNPDIYENKIVWVGMSSDAGGDIYMYDLGPDGIKNTNDDGGLQRITHALKTQGQPKIYKDIIVSVLSKKNDICLALYQLKL